MRRPSGELILLTTFCKPKYPTGASYRIQRGQCDLAWMLLNEIEPPNSTKVKRAEISELCNLQLSFAPVILCSTRNVDAEASKHMGSKEIGALSCGTTKEPFDLEDSQK